jgi:hypothetical protein
MTGLFKKYIVKKADGSDVDPDAQYFVLRVDTDDDARFALATYARWQPDEDLRTDLLAWVEAYEELARLNRDVDRCEAAEEDARRLMEDRRGKRDHDAFMADWNRAQKDLSKARDAVRTKRLALGISPEPAKKEQSDVG